jgi:hypothetical protein
MFYAHIHTATSVYDCPVPGCIGTANTGFNLQRNFVMRHPAHVVIISKEGSMPFPSAKALSTGHMQTELCRDLCAWKEQHAAARDSQLALNTQFTVYG